MFQFKSGEWLSSELKVYILLRYQGLDIEMLMI